MRTNEEMFKELDQFIEQECNCDEQELIAILHRAQEIFGYLPMVVQAHIARKLGINVSKVYGVVSFYSFFTMEPKGEFVISICMGTACFVRGSDKILERCEQILGIKNGETTPDGKLTATLRQKMSRASLLSTNRGGSKQCVQKLHLKSNSCKCTTM